MCMGEGYMPYEGPELLKFKETVQNWLEIEGDLDDFIFYDQQDWNWSER